MSPLPRWVALPVAAVALVAGTVVVQVQHGGGDYVPLRPPDACAERTVTSRATGIDGLTEQLVLTGLADAACSLGVGREELTLRLARSDRPTDAQVDALRAGLRSAVAQMKAASTLPKASTLVDEVLDDADLNGLVKRIVRALPDSVVDGALRTDDVLYRTIDGLDLRRVLADVDDASSLQAQVEPVVEQAVKDSLEARLRDLI